MVKTHTQTSVKTKCVNYTKAMTLLLMDLFTATNYMLFETVGIDISYDTMFAITTIAFNKKVYVPQSQTPVDTRSDPPQLADPETTS